MVGEGHRSSMPPRIRHADAAFEARLRRKLEEGNVASRPSASADSSASAAKAYEEKVKRKLSGGGGTGADVRDERIGREAAGASDRASSPPRVGNRRREFEERPRRGLSEGGKGGGRSSAESAASAGSESKRRNEGGRRSGCRASMPPRVGSAKEAFEERLRRKLLEEGDDGGRSSDDPAAGEEKIKQESNREGGSHRTSRRGSLPSRFDDEEAFEERLRRKLMEEGKSGGRSSADSVFEAGEETKLTSKRNDGGHRQRRRASLPARVDDDENSFEGRLRRKVLERNGGRRSSKKLKRKGSKGKREGGARRTTRSGTAGNSEEIGGKSEGGSGGRGARPFGLSSSMPCINAPIERGGSKQRDAAHKSTNGNRGKHKASQKEAVEMLRSLDEYAFDDVDDGVADDRATMVQTPPLSGDSTVSFDDVFSALRQFKQQNEGSLSIPVSHPSFLQIMDSLSSLGLDERLKERWDRGMAELRAFEKEHGHCAVPLAHPILGEWARTQREHFELYTKRLPSPLTKRQYNKLKDVGFDQVVECQESKGAVHTVQDGDKGSMALEDNGTASHLTDDPIPGCACTDIHEQIESDTRASCGVSIEPRILAVSQAESDDSSINPDELFHASTAAASDDLDNRRDFVPLSRETATTTASRPAAPNPSRGIICNEDFVASWSHIPAVLPERTISKRDFVESWSQLPAVVDLGDTEEDEGDMNVEHRAGNQNYATRTGWH
ncbi:hypothetical protein ACHAWF_005368 [Thalassiosira exigua]